MKKNLFFLALIIVFINTSIVYGQTMYNRHFLPKYGFGLKVGANFASQFSPGNNEVFDVKSIMGITAGGYYDYFLNRVIALQTEISVSVKGSHWIESNYGQNEMKDILTYIDLPLLIRYQPINSFNLYAGPQVSYLAKGMQYDYSTGLKTVIEDYYKAFDFGLVVGIEANLPKNINLTVRYGRGLISAYKSGGYYFSGYNNYIQFTAGYRFERKMKLQSKTKSSLRRTK